MATTAAFQIIRMVAGKERYLKMKKCVQLFLLLGSALVAQVLAAEKDDAVAVRFTRFDALVENVSRETTMKQEEREKLTAMLANIRLEAQYLNKVTPDDNADPSVHAKVRVLMGEVVKSGRADLIVALALDITEDTAARQACYYILMNRQVPVSKADVPLLCQLFRASVNAKEIVTEGKRTWIDPVTFRGRIGKQIADLCAIDDLSQAKGEIAASVLEKNPLLWLRGVLLYGIARSSDNEGRQLFAGCLLEFVH